MAAKLQDVEVLPPEAVAWAMGVEATAAQMEQTMGALAEDIRRGVTVLALRSGEEAEVEAEAGGAGGGAMRRWREAPDSHASPAGERPAETGGGGAARRPGWRGGGEVHGRGPGFRSGRRDRPDAGDRKSVV